MYDRLNELVMLAIGRASMCGAELPHIAFNDQLAQEIGEKLIKDIRNYIDQHSLARAETALLVGEETTLEELRPGAVFMTRDGTYAVKSEYTYPDRTVDAQYQCILLESGEFAHFPDKNRTLVHEVRVEGFSQ